MAQITLTIDDAHVPLLRQAIAEDYNLLDANGARRLPTLGEVKGWFADRGRDVVRSRLRPAKERAALAAITDDEVTIT